MSSAERTRPGLSLRRHLDDLLPALLALDDDLEVVDRWGRELAPVLLGGARLLAVGNGGSAAHAQHLTSELVGRYRKERRAFSALALHGETSALTAIANDYGIEQCYARQVEAHGRVGDVLIAISTSGRSPNVLAAADVARANGLRVWALTGPAPNPLVLRCHEHVAVDAGSTATVQEVHQVIVHLLCEAFDDEVEQRSASVSEPSAVPCSAVRR